MAAFLYIKSFTTLHLIEFQKQIKSKVKWFSDAQCKHWGANPGLHYASEKPQT
jgi:hypothetical protein